MEAQLRVQRRCQECLQEAIGTLEFGDVAPPRLGITVAGHQGQHHPLAAYPAWQVPAGTHAPGHRGRSRLGGALGHLRLKAEQGHIALPTRPACPRRPVRHACRWRRLQPGLGWPDGGVPLVQALGLPRLQQDQPQAHERRQRLQAGLRLGPEGRQQLHGEVHQRRPEERDLPREPRGTARARGAGAQRLLTPAAERGVAEDVERHETRGVQRRGSHARVVWDRGFVPQARREGLRGGLRRDEELVQEVQEEASSARLVRESELVLGVLQVGLQVCQQQTLECWTQGPKCPRATAAGAALCSWCP
mmetsp:Transcript_6110/g.18136  ORF Transcript_6110/g.18136 Transcript_6110/m.18136 type:complete len:305 (+) Transcript_6110:1003-1917(+)